MSSILEDTPQVLPFPSPSLATEAATELGESVEDLVPPSGSTELPEEELAVGVLDFEAARQLPSGRFRKTLWYLVSRQRNELIHQASFEAGEEQLGYPAAATASATELAEFWRAMETLVPRTDPAFAQSRTKLGSTLREIRQRYLSRGGSLLTDQELNEDLAERRGERE